MNQRADDYRKWRVAQQGDGGAARSRGTPLADYRQWKQARAEAASERAALAMETVGFDQTQAVAAVERQDAARAQGLDVPATLAVDPKGEFAKYIEKRTRRSELMQSSKLAEWVVADPVNAALAESNLRNLSGLEATVDSLGKGTVRATAGVGSRQMVRDAERAYDANRYRLEDRGKSVLDIYQELDEKFLETIEETGRIDGSQPTNQVSRFGAALGRYLTAQLSSVFETEDTAQALVDRKRKAFEQELERAGEFDEGQLRRWGRTSDRARMDELVATASAAGGPWEQTKAFADLMMSEPVSMASWITFTALESAPTMATAAATTLATRRPSAGAAVMGASSYSVSSSMNYQELVRESGFDMTDPEQRRAFIESPEVRMRLNDQSFVYGTIVGLMDAASGGVAGKTLARSPAGDFVLQAMTQAVMGSSGEYLGMVASGQDVDMVEVIVEGLAEMVTTPLEVVGVGGRKLGAARQTAQSRRFFNALADSAEGSELRKKLPKKYREAVDKLTKDGPAETLYVDAQALDEMFQSQPDGSTTAEQFLGAIPGVDVTKYREAVDTGGVVEIPTASYASDVVGTKFDALLRDHLRIDPTHMSHAEFVAYQSQLEELSKAADDAAARAEEGQTKLAAAVETARSEMVSRLRRAGRSARVAELEATQAVEVAATLAQRLGISFEDFTARFPLADVQSALDTDPTVRPTRVTVEMVERARDTAASQDDQTSQVIREAAEVEGLDLETASELDVEQAIERVYGPGSSGVLLNQEPNDPRVLYQREPVRRDDLRGDGRGFTEFFSDVTKGVRQQPVRLDQYVPVIDLPQDTKDFADERAPYSGNFEDHIRTSIPGYREMQDAVGHTISKRIGKGKLLDIGGSEGAMAKAVVARNPEASAVIMDPNVDMRNTFASKPQVEGVTYELAALGAEEDAGKLAWTEKDGTDIPYFDPKGVKFDIVHEGMVFQFISSARDAQVARVKEMMAEDGIFLTFEKFGNDADVFAANEARKNEFKALYYDAETLAAKEQEVLRTGGDAIEGMTALQVKVGEYEQTLLNNFRFVFQIWDSGNFKGYVASDSYFDANMFVESLPSLGSDYATSMTPRRVYDAQKHFQLPVNDDGTITLTHWSTAPRDVLRVDKAGTGPTRGDERRRSGPPKVYFGIAPGEPGGYTKDVAASIRHDVDVPLDVLYDFDRDPDGLKARIPDDVVGPQRMGWLEQKIKDEGYKGYFVRSGPVGASAVMYEDVQTDPERIVDDSAAEQEAALRDTYGNLLYQSGAEPVFFSALTREVENAKQKRAGAKEWMAIINKLPGVKKAEIDWSGVEAWLAAQEGQIAREAVAAFLRENEVEVQAITKSGEAVDEDSDTGVPGYEVVVDDRGNVIEEDDDYLRESGMERYEDDIVGEMASSAAGDFAIKNEDDFIEAFPHLDQPGLLRDLVEATLLDQYHDRTPDDSPQAEWVRSHDDYSPVDKYEVESDAYERAYDDYVSDPNYEYYVYITYPDGSTDVTSIEDFGGDIIWEGNPYRNVWEARDAVVEHYRDDAVDRLDDNVSGGGARWGEYTEDGGDNYREILLTVPNLQDRGPNAALDVREYVNSQHFEEPNIVVYARTKERLAADGSKVLFVEEVQSDLGSYWRERGGFTPPDANALEAARAAHAEAINAATEARRRHAEARNEVVLRLEERAKSAGVQLPDSATTLTTRAYRAARTGVAPMDTDGANPLFDAAIAWATEDFKTSAYDDLTGSLDDLEAAASEASAAEAAAADRLYAERNRQGSGNPATPFEGEAYYALMMKKLLRMAAEQGADRLAWTPAYMQARRWSGAVQNVVQEIGWSGEISKEMTGVDGNKIVSLSGVNGIDSFVVNAEGVITDPVGYGRIPFDSVQGKKLSDLIGGVMAKRVLEEDSGSIEGENIVIGGDGYKIAYDQQIKKFVEKFAKKYGSKVTVDKTMPDFAKQTNADPLETTVNQVGHNNVIARLRTSGIRDDAFWDAYDNRFAERWEAGRAAAAGIVEKDEAKIAEYDSLLTKAENGEELPLLQTAETVGANRRLLLTHLDIRRERLAQFDNAEAYAVAMYNDLVRAGHFTEKQVKTVLPEHKEAKGDAVWSVEITDQMRAAALEAQPLFQRRPEGARGSILLPTEPGRAPLVTLFPKADLSTFLHESGHYYLHILQELVRTGDMTEGMLADWETIRRWWYDNADAVAEDGGVTAEQVRTYLDRGPFGDPEIDRAVNVGLQEQWAKAYEAYLMEGKSPSNALRAAFEAFGAWLLSVYRGARKLDVEINPALREVFDRMLATDEQIALAATQNGFDDIVAASAEALGVSAEEYQHLVRLAGDAQDEARQRMLREVMAPIRRAKTDAFRAERAEVEADIAATVHAKPANRVREWLGNERWIGAPDDDPNPNKLPLDLRMNRRSIVEDYGQDVLDALPRGSRPLVTDDTTLGADDVAGWFGYKSGDEMLQDLISSPPAADEIRARTDAEMRKRHGDPFNDGSVEETAIAALHGEKRGQLLAAELRALAKTGKKGQATTRRQATEIARRTIRQMPIAKAVRSGTFLAAERRAGERATLAVARRDMDEAYAAKREQLLNHALYIESRKADELLGRIESRVAKLKKASVRKNLAGEYLEAIDDILTSYDFRKSVTQRGAQRRAGLAAYVEMMKAAGRENELAIPAHVLDAARRRPYKTVPVNELEGVLDSLINIEHTARMKQKLRDAQRARELDATVNEIVAEMDKNLEDKPQNRVATPADKRGAAAREFLNLLLNADTILRKIGGFDRGKAYDAIKEPIDDAANWAAVKRAEAAEAFDRLYSVYSKKDQRRMAVRKHHAALGGAFTKWDLISAALNMGNADNLARLTDKDSGGGFNTAQVDYIKNQLDERDWAFVQSVWDYVGSYWPLIEEREKRLTGVAPKRVVATEVVTPFGTRPGGYYPIRYRGDVSGMVAAEELAEVQQRMMAGRFGKAQTRAGHLEERANGSGGRVLQLGMEVLHQHIGQVIHDLAFSEAVTNSWRVLQDPRVRTTFERKGLLKDHQSLELWLQDTATGQLAAGGIIGKWSLRAKNGFTLSKLLLNLSTVMIQMTGVVQSAVVIGPRNLAVGYGTYLSNPVRTSAEVVEASPFMRERETTFNRDINDLLDDLTLGPTASRTRRAQNVMAQYGFLLMQKVQFYGVDVPTWYGAYHEGLAKFDKDEAKARAHADRMVARAQASGVFADRSAFERGTLSHDTRQSGFIRLFTALGSYMFAKGNIAYEVYGRTRRDMTGFNASTLTAALRGALDMTMLFTIEAIAYNLIKGTLPGGDDDDESWAKFLARETVLSMMSTIPFVRDIGSAMSGFEAGAYASIGETLSRPIQQLAQGDADLALAKAVSNVVGVATGAPSGQLNRIMDAWYRLEQGEDVAPIEFIMGRSR